eukprot:Blabericola_migrator_1__12027@NODE_739_length_6686_cov_203_338118_g530_i0_p3_GENE_NODE_739_length_6686_cov_203_338118_g530_i0NODE_739_length_6686_cov_203_338118_g530_i0_p3_ORF_typecomplete_len298_score4_00TPT/PF03151_16/2_8e38UAA/PF08449_11/1_1e19CRTlike/PF08627_10/2_6e14CRTlike/PF08627_10/0_0031EamA/PF00892_20/6_9e08EamA/PF00892_20/4_9e06SLC35F/PF06027_12/1e13PUNUT/PF16913_5/3e11Nuc_sug_transp/PF04142_15/8_3e08Mg_trans_NIPA/PF05653_14/2_3e02Mg_trans_NIPA/PF05653_14/6_2e05Mg_trans_NIPA/PF05653_1
MTNRIKRISFIVYAFSSASFVLGNRAVLKSHHRPLTITFYQQLIVVSIYILDHIIRLHKIPFKLDTFKDAAPCAIAFLGMVALNNLCLTYATVIGYTIARATTIIWNLILSKIFLHKKTSLSEWFGCLLVASAVFVGYLEDKRKSNPEIIGLLLGSFASLSQAIFSCQLSITFKKHKEPYHLQGHYTLIAVVILFIVTQIIGIEKGYDTLPSGPILIMGLLNAIVAFSALTSLSVSNPVTVNLIGYFKSTIQAVMGWLIFGDEFTMSKIMALFCTVTGTLIYSVARQNQKRKIHKLA